jgi:type II secretion system protein C
MVRFIRKHFWVINLIFIAGAAWLVAYVFSVVIQDRLTTNPMPNFPKGPGLTSAGKSEPYDHYAPITERNIFNPGEKGLKLLPLEEKRMAAMGARGGSESGRSIPSGGYQLVGTVTGPGTYSWAILQEGADRKQRIVRFRGNIDDAKIVQISRKGILIQRQGKEEAISFSEKEVPTRATASPPAPKGPKGEVVQKLSANRFLVNREDVASAVGNVNQFMTQARFRPHFVMGRPSGFSVSEIQPGSLMEKIGLQNNDVIKKVNGQLITSPEEVFKAYSQLQRDSNIEVEVERGNRSEVFRYEIR